MTNLDDPRMKAFKERMNGGPEELYNLFLDDPRYTEEEIKSILKDDYPDFCEYRKQVKSNSGK